MTGKRTPAPLDDIVSDVLKSLHVSGSVLLRKSYAAPWAISITDRQRINRILDIDETQQAVVFHIVEHGECLVKPGDANHVQLKTGEILISFGGHPHTISQGNAANTQSLQELLASGVDIQPPPPIKIGVQASLLCGVFLLQHTKFNPLFESLPSVLHSKLSATDNGADVVRLLIEEMNCETVVSTYIVERLLEIICAEAIRSYIDSLPQNEKSWLRGVQDPVIGRAIAAIHAQPGAEWSVKKLASKMAMSPSRFAARFVASVGDSPMAYTTKWRMNLACQSLINTKSNIDQIALKMGYRSPAAFSRTFKKHLGTSPATWRSLQAISAD